MAKKLFQPNFVFLKRRIVYNELMPAEALSIDNQLAIAAATDEQAFSRLYEMYLPRIFAYVTRRICDRDEAEDIVSNIFLRVVENIARFNPEKSSFKTWIYTITTNMMIDYFRAHGKKKTEKIEAAHEIASTNPSPVEQAAKTHDKDFIHKIIGALPNRHQELLLLKFFSDLNVEELAEALGVTPNNVSVMTHRALAAFEITYKRYV